MVVVVVLVVVGFNVVGGIMADVCTIMGIDLVGVTWILMLDERRVSMLADGMRVGVPCTDTVGVTPGVPATATARRLRLLVDETNHPNTGLFS